MKTSSEELGQITFLLDSLKPGDTLSIWRAGIHDDVEHPGSWGAQLLTPDEMLDDDVPASRNGVECYSAGQGCWQEALAEAGLMTSEGGRTIIWEYEMPNTSELEDILYSQIIASGLPLPIRQYRLPGSKRKFAFDFAWPEHRLLVEVQGGIWIPNTGHSSGKGITRDCDKFNEAVMLGWRLLLLTAKSVHTGSGLDMIRKMLDSSREG